MGKYGKWLGGGLGFAFGGPIGAIIGFAIGGIFDSAKVDINDISPRSRHNDFGVSMLILSAAVVKADGKMYKSELNYIRDFYTRQFGSEATQEYISLLKDILDKEIPVQEVCSQIQQGIDYSARLLLLQYLYGVSNADGAINQKEIALIQMIAGYLGISQNDYESIQSMFVKSFDNPFKILEITDSASDDEVKKAYRQMALKYHPDKVIDLGEEHQNAAKEKFQKVQDAYERIKKQRNIN